MKRNTLALTGFFVLCGALIAGLDGCAGSAEPQIPSQIASAGGGNASSGAVAVPEAVRAISGKTWKLAEIRKGGAVITINRKKFEADGFGDLFTLTFGELITGKASPNTYRAPYQAGADGSLAIRQPAGTLMASFYQTEGITEYDYFQYLTRVKSWKLNKGRLELGAADQAGNEAVLVYIN